jgi:hypothetical protein
MTDGSVTPDLAVAFVIAAAIALAARAPLRAGKLPSTVRNTLTAFALAMSQAMLLAAMPLDGHAAAAAAADRAPLAAVARSVGSDSTRLLARVSRIRYEVYPGVFRGAAATLTDGAGNDYDRALLLHDLAATSVPTGDLRYAFCTLSSRQSAAAVAAARRDYVAPHVGASAQALAAQAKTPKLRAGFAGLAVFWSRATKEAREQTTQLAADFRKAGVQLKAPSTGNLQSIAADHVWVQRRSQGRWIDLDPALPHATPGASLCAAARTSPTLPAAAYDTVTATLRLESRDGGQQHDARIASGTWRTADLADRLLNFAFAEPSGLHAAAPQPAGMRAYTPLLIAGTRTIAAAPIVVPAPTHTPSIPVTTGALSQVAGLFGNAPPPAATPSKPTPSGPIPVALQLDVTVTAAATPRVTVERSIFDRVSAADRAAGRAATAKLAPSSLLPFGTLWNIAVNLGTGVVGVGDRSALAPNSEEPAVLARDIGAMHRAYYVMRRGVFADAVVPPAPPLVSVRPGVSFLGAAPQAEGITRFGLAIDRAGEGAAPDGGDAASGLAWGVASLYGERLAIATPTMLAAHDNLDTLPFDDVIEMFYIARHTHIAPAHVRSGSDIAAITASADAKARLTASMAGDASAVITSVPVSYGGANDDGWWILGTDGSVSDEMQSGMHVEFGEEGLAEKEIAEEAPAFRRIGFITRCAGIAAATLMAIAAAQGGEASTEIAQMAAEQIHAIYEANEAEEMREAALKCTWE